MSADRIIIAGGGIIGCSLAWRLAQRGVAVTVVEKDQPVSKASWAAAGMLHPFIKSDTPALHQLAHASLTEFPAFVAELRAATGIDAELQLEASSGSGSVDNRKLGHAAQQAAAAAGVEFKTGVGVHGIARKASEFEAAELSDGTRLEGDAIVVAAGAWSGEVLGLPARVAVFPVRGQMLAVEHIPQLVPHIVITDECYLVPRGAKRLLIGATVEHVGFDARVTEEGIKSLLVAACKVEPRIADAQIVDRWAGLRPGTPDDLPIVGADPEVRGVYYATGHYRNGILLAPITARVLTDLIVDGQTSFELRPFSIARFA